MYYVILILDLLLLLEIWNGGQIDLPPLKKLLSKSSALLGLKVIYEQQKQPSYWEKILSRKVQKISGIRHKIWKKKIKIAIMYQRAWTPNVRNMKTKILWTTGLLHYKAQVKTPIVKKGNICIFKKDFLP